MKHIVTILLLVTFVFPIQISAQEHLPEDNGLATYHTHPRYRVSESHPVRVLGYIMHPIGWVFREAIFRPLSYFASSTPERRSVMGYRDPYDYRKPECFSSDSAVPDCRAYPPYNYQVDDLVDDEPEVIALEPSADYGVRSVYFPDVNFDFDKSDLNDLGKGRVRQIAALLKQEPGLQVVLEGHADFIGSEDYNERLGTTRSEAVRKELVALGVSPDRLSSITFGKSRPALPEETDWARAVNRRVEIHLDDASAPKAAFPSE